MSLVWSNELEANKREQEACSPSFLFIHSSSNVYLYRLYFLFVISLFSFGLFFVLFGLILMVG